MTDKDEEMLQALEKAKKEPHEEVEGKQGKLRELYAKTAFAQVHTFYNLIARISQAKVLKEIHDKKLYKLECSEFEEYCQRHFNRGRQSIYEDFKILEFLSMDFVRISDKIGFKYSLIRRISRLSEKDFVRTANDSIAIGENIYPLIPENKKEIEEAIAEVELKLKSEKRRANGLKKMADSREEKAEKLERELKELRNPNAQKSKIEQLIDIADDSIMIGLDRIVGVARLILKTEQETKERIPERDGFEILIDRLGKRFPEVIKQAREKLKQCEKLELIRGEAEKEGIPLNELPEE